MRVVYTALIGAYERLNEQPVVADSSVPFICFTDDPTLVSDTWKIELVEPRFGRDPIRSARRLKLLGHPLLADFDESLWIDNSVVLAAPPEDILDDWLGSADIAIPEHSFRDSLMDEFEAVVSCGFDDPTRVYEQLQHYHETVPDVLARRPLWTALLARRRTPTVTAFCELWYEHVLRYSRRDQLSVLMAVELSPDLCLRAVGIDNNASVLHRWPVVAGRGPSGEARDPIEAMKPLVARVHGLEHRLLELEDQLAAGLDRADSLAAVVHQRDVDMGIVRSEADHLRDRISTIESSNTWRAGRLVARLGGPLVRGIRRRRGTPR